MAARKKKKLKRSEFNSEVLGAIVAGAGQPKRKAGTPGGGPNRSTFFEAVLTGTQPLGTMQTMRTPGRRRTSRLSSRGR
jgi:hypothetical protein